MNVSELRGIHVLAKLNDSLLERLLSHCEPVEFAAGDMIIKQGQKADAIYFLIEGRVTSFVTETGGGQSPLRSSEAGSHFGEVGVIQHGIRTAAVRATTKCRVFRISLASFEAILTEPELATPLLYAFARSMSLRLADITHRLAEAQSLNDAWLV